MNSLSSPQIRHLKQVCKNLQSSNCSRFFLLLSSFFFLRVTKYIPLTMGSHSSLGHKTPVTYLYSYPLKKPFEIGYKTRGHSFISFFFLFFFFEPLQPFPLKCYPKYSYLLSCLFKSWTGCYNPIHWLLLIKYEYNKFWHISC